MQDGCKTFHWLTKTTHIVSLTNVHGLVKDIYFNWAPCFIKSFLKIYLLFQICISPCVSYHFFSLKYKIYEYVNLLVIPCYVLRKVKL